MSLLCNINSLKDEEIKLINKTLKLKLEQKYGYAAPKYFLAFDILNNSQLSLPFSFGKTHLNLKRRGRNEYTGTNLKFKGVLRDEQQQVEKEAINILNKRGSILLSMYCGFGKTITSISIALKIKLKTLIIVNKIVLINQWEQSINQFCPEAIVQKLKPKCSKENADFYIVNAINVEKFSDNFFHDIGVVIVDEAHLIMAERLSKSLRNIFPRYLLGLSATPYRPDGLNDLLTFYFGKRKIIRELQREHIVYKVTTKFKPTIEMAQNGRVNWGVVLDSQANNVKRNELIIDLVKHFKDRTILILVKRIDQAKYLIERLEESKEDVTSLIGSKQTFCETSRILVGTSSKVGTGFDHPKLDTLLLASDLQEYFIQYLGRCMRRKDIIPYIIDIVDDYSLFKKHYNTRKNIYMKHGGRIVDFKI